MFELASTLLLSLATLVVLVVWYLQRKTTFWSQKGVAGPKPQLLFGNLQHRSAAPPDEVELDWQNRFGKVYGLYYGLRPVLSVADHQLVKQVLIKDFGQWSSRRELSVYHEMWNQNLFVLEGERWKTVRATVSPSFTSGKLKGMHRLMASCIDRLEAYLDGLVADKARSEFAVKEVIIGLTLDVVAKSIFATEIGSNNPTDRNNQFVRHATNLFKFPGFKILAFLAFPRWLNDLLGIQIVFPEEAFTFFRNLSYKVMRERQEANRQGKAKHQDMMQLLVDASVDVNKVAALHFDKLMATSGEEADELNLAEGEHKRKLTNNEILSTNIFLFVAGFETTASTLNYALFELAGNVHLQERLHREVSEAVAGLDEKSDEYHQVVNTGVALLEAVIKETLRKYCPVVRLERRLEADNYNLGGIELERNQLVEIPVYAVHWNPEYYPEPEKYRPERFLPENKHLLTPNTYIPFGDGPRNCVGMRFAYQEIRLVLARLVTKFRFELAPDTPHKFRFLPGNPILSTDSFPLIVSRRWTPMLGPSSGLIQFTK